MASFMESRAPSLFISHGTGPMPLLDPGHESYRQLLRSHGTILDGVKGILLISAHWETDQPHLSSATSPGVYYDYEDMRHMLPKEAFEFEYPAKGDPEMASAIAKHLELKGFSPVLDPTRGFDHAVYVPMTLMRPKADIPIIQLSILRGQNEKDSTEKNIKLGEALACFRDRGWAICGSGGSYHDFDAIAKAFFEHKVIPPSEHGFEEFLKSACKISDSTERRHMLLNWRSCPDSFKAHKEGESDHFMPFLVAAAGGGDTGGEMYDKYEYRGAPMSFYKW